VPLALIHALVMDHAESTMYVRVTLDGGWEVIQEEIALSASAFMNLHGRIALCLMDQLTIMQNAPIRESVIAQLANANATKVMKEKVAGVNLVPTVALGMGHVKQ